MQWIVSSGNDQWFMEKHFTDVGNEIIDRVGCHGIGLHSQPYSIYLLKVI
jgi:hypothetical protein